QPVLWVWLSWSWKEGEPNNGGNNEDCAVLYKEGKWNDIHCDKQVKFVCEKEEISE
uniref:C-type lectin domain-containing protein n=1 Tax=Pseudonaja textilis TaxID=8673 RepID=A0A670XZM5_PSETE